MVIKGTNLDQSKLFDIMIADQDVIFIAAYARGHSRDCNQVTVIIDSFKSPQKLFSVIRNFEVRKIERNVIHISLSCNYIDVEIIFKG